MSDRTPFLDLRSGVGLVVANMIGAGVFLSAGFMAQELRPVEILLAWHRPRSQVPCVPISRYPRTMSRWLPVLIVSLPVVLPPPDHDELRDAQRERERVSHTIALASVDHRGEPLRPSAAVMATPDRVWNDE